MNFERCCVDNLKGWEFSDMEEKFLKDGYVINLKSMQNYTLLYLATKNDMLELIKNLVEKYKFIPVIRCGKDLNNCLHVASRDVF